jgi:recombinational DNA repair ATPase RecF
MCIADKARSQLIDEWMDEEWEGQLYKRMEKKHPHLLKHFPKLEEKKEEYVERYIDETAQDMIEENMDPHTYYGVHRSDF